jgi:DnaT-like ssDNA binding protein
MALLIEDGTGVVGSNSYVTLADARAYALARGLVLPVDPDLEPLIIRATDYLESLRSRYQGTKTNGAGCLQWPRTGVEIDGDVIGPDTIPGELKDVQCQLAFELSKVDPMPTSTGPAIKEKTIGPLKTVWAVSDDSGTPRPQMPKVDALLEPLCRRGSVTMRTVRI